jgi:hypothetical protein
MGRTRERDLHIGKRKAFGRTRFDERQRLNHSRRSAEKSGVPHRPTQPAFRLWHLQWLRRRDESFRLHRRAGPRPERDCCRNASA